ncbi:esterase family protein [Seonamhaeicola sp. MEBiC1930]|uniref:alpha/beta hydrolase n=1 Tax=Seonamhaeicola sp. MEBiC01930 TaxID=2976768 RepID=UPI0032562F8B
MKKLGLLLFTVLNINTVFGQNGEILKNQIYTSSLLEQDIYYNIYLPPNYDFANDYPVIYFLHGFGGNHNESIDFMQTIDSLICRKSFPETIIIAPNGKTSWYIDDYAGKFNFSSMFIKEFIPFAKRTYLISNDVNQSIITGISMGGFGALRFTLLYPNEFGICVSFMAGISTKEQICNDSEEDYLIYHHELYGKNLKPFERANNFFVKNNPLYIAQQTSSDLLKKKKWFIQVCDDDYHSLPNAKLHVLFHKLSVNHEFRIKDGRHDGDCVNKSMNDAIEFIKANLTRN